MASLGNVSKKQVQVEKTKFCCSHGPHDWAAKGEINPSISLIYFSPVSQGLWSPARQSISRALITARAALQPSTRRSERNMHVWVCGGKQCRHRVGEQTLHRKSFGLIQRFIPDPSSCEGTELSWRVGLMCTQLSVCRRYMLV